MPNNNTQKLRICQGMIPDEFAPSQPPSAALAGFVAADLDLVAEHIHAIYSPQAASAGPTLDAQGCTILPGFIDVHVHGGAGFDTMDASVEALTTMARFFAQHGVTTFLPTTMTAPHPAILQAIAAVARQPAQALDGARIIGVHVEGPYISPKFPGAQPAIYIRQPSLDEFDALVAAGPVRMITLAPEEPGAAGLIAAALQHNVVAVLGHTNATYAECETAFAAGVTQATHTYNAMSALHHRYPGTLGAVLSNDAIYAQLIADTIHVHPAAIKILARCKGVQRTILITDAIRATGLADGKYDLGGQMVTVQGAICTLADGTLAGSVLTMERALANFMAATGLSLAEAWPTTSRTPAASLGLDGVTGSIVPGYWADLVLLDNALQVVATIVAGRIVYLRDPERLTP